MTDDDFPETPRAGGLEEDERDSAPAPEPASVPESPAVESPPSEGTAPADGPRKTGTMKWYSLAKGYGFVVADDGGPDVFVHHSALKEAGEQEPLDEGERVEFSVEDSERGLRARRVRRID